MPLSTHRLTPLGKVSGPERKAFCPPLPAASFTTWPLAQALSAAWMRVVSGLEALALFATAVALSIAGSVVLGEANADCMSVAFSVAHTALLAGRPGSAGSVASSAEMVAARPPEDEDDEEEDEPELLDAPLLLELDPPPELELDELDELELPELLVVAFAPVAALLPPPPPPPPPPPQATSIAANRAASSAPGAP